MAVEHMKTWRVGRVEITRLVEVWKWEDDIGMALEGGKPSMVLAQPWLLPEHATPEGRMFINFQAFVLKAGKRRIMIDTCVGADREREFAVFTRMRTTFLEDLASIGITPGDVDTVLCTHLHFDHVGWNTRLVDGHWVPTFPKARYLFSRKEYDHWMMLRETGGYHGINHLADSVDPVVAAGLVDFITHEHRISDEIRLTTDARPHAGSRQRAHQLGGRASRHHGRCDAPSDSGGNAGAPRDFRHGQGGRHKDSR